MVEHLRNNLKVPVQHKITRSEIQRVDGRASFHGQQSVPGTWISIVMILSVSRDCMLIILQPPRPARLLPSPRKFFKSSSSPFLTAYHRFLVHPGASGARAHALAAPELVASRGARDAFHIDHRGALTDVKGKMDGEVPPCATMLWLGGCNHDPSKSRHENLSRGTLLSLL